jgi:hypothetical protein
MKSNIPVSILHFCDYLPFEEDLALKIGPIHVDYQLDKLPTNI